VSADFEVQGLVFGGGTGWHKPMLTDQHELLLVRSGAFRFRSNGVEEIAEPALGWATEPDCEVQTALLPCGDVCTVIGVAPELWRPFAGPVVRVDARMEIAHRRLLRAMRSGDVTYAAAEALCDLLRARDGSGKGPAVVDAAREAILTDHPAACGLIPLARHLQTSPFTLSRAFRSQTGLSLTRYRNRIRVSRALHRLEEGDRDLGGLAADLGFADQAHLTRTMTEHTGYAPGRVRTLLGPTRALPAHGPATCGLGGAPARHLRRAGSGARRATLTGSPWAAPDG
jgi:AraC-like DNA-binding protein